MEKSKGLTFGEVVTGILGIGGLIGLGVVGIKSAIVEAEKASFLEKERIANHNRLVDIRLNELNERYQTATEDKKELIKNEIERLMESRSDYKNSNFGVLNTLFDVITTSASVMEIIKASKQRDELLKEEDEEDFDWEDESDSKQVDSILKMIDKLDARIDKSVDFNEINKLRSLKNRYIKRLDEI